MADEQARTVVVFFYGLFMDEALLHEKGVVPRKPRLAFVEKFRLAIGARATLVPSPDERVYGIVYSLTHREVDALYAEPSVSLYRPEAVSAQLADGGTVPALCFNLPDPPARAERNPEYAEKLRALAGRLGLPRDYVAAID